MVCVLPSEIILLNTCMMIIFSCLCISYSFFSPPQGNPGEKGATGSSDIIDFNGKLLDAFQVSDIKVSLRPDLWMHHMLHQAFITESQVRLQARL